MFNRSSFSPVSFSTISFNGARLADEGRSGYWRLFFTNLQEEALKKRDEKTTEPARQRPVVQATQPKDKKQPKPALPKRRKKVEVEKPLPIIPFRKLPTKLEPTAFDELAKLPAIAFDLYIQQLTGVIINLDEERAARRRSKRKKLAAFLLMAA